MNIYKNCLLALTLCVAGTGISTNAFAAGVTLDAQGSKLKAYDAGRWVPSETFVKKNAYCYREYICRSGIIDRFGRNVRIKGKKSLQRGKSVCSGASNTCQCKTAPPTLKCDVRFLKRR